MKNYIPNTITSLNLVFGVLAIFRASEGDINTAAWFILVAAVMDFFDGFAARWLKAYSATGEQLDSLADLISFGMAPAVIAYAFIEQADISLNILGYSLSLAFIVVLLPLFAALRLARFNVDQAQRDAFTGVPVPATALFFAGLALSASHTASYPEFISMIGRLAFSGWLMVLLVVVFAFFMVMPVSMFSLKMKSFSWKGNEVKYGFIIVSLLLVVLFQVAALPVIIMVYVITGIINNAVSKKSLTDDA